MGGGISRRIIETGKALVGDEKCTVGWKVIDQGMQGANPCPMQTNKKKEKKTMTDDTDTAVKTFTFRIPDDMFEQLERVAQQEDRSKGSVIRQLLQTELERRDRSTDR